MREWQEVRKELFTPEEIAESDLRVALIGELIKARQEKGITQKQLAMEVGVSPSRISDYISGRSEPTLRIASILCRVLDIQPAAMLRL